MLSSSLAAQGVKPWAFRIRTTLGRPLPVRVKATHCVPAPSFGGLAITAVKSVAGARPRAVAMSSSAIDQSAPLKTKKCIACEGGDVKALTESEAVGLQQQCPDWRIGATESGDMCITREWKVRNFLTGLELFKRVAEVAEAEGHHPDLHLVGYNRVTAQLSTHSVHGLTENDFIMAAKMDELDLSDLLSRRRAK